MKIYNSYLDINIFDYQPNKYKINEYNKLYILHFNQYLKHTNTLII